MPFYDYECDSCDNEFEEKHLIADRHTPVDKICGQCGLREVENVEHFVLRCGGLVREREVLMKRMAEVTTGFAQ